jgi:hypothetical protein
MPFQFFGICRNRFSNFVRLDHRGLQGWNSQGSPARRSWGPAPILSSTDLHAFIQSDSLKPEEREMSPSKRDDEPLMPESTTASGQPRQPEAFVRVEIRDSVVHKTEGIKIPLGYIDGGAWVAPRFVDDQAEIDSEELVDWLLEEQRFGPPLALSRDHAQAMVADTLKRCLALADAAHRIAHD